MPTRFLLHSTGTSPLPALAFDSQWEQTAQAVRLPMDMKRQLTSITALADSTVTVPITTTQQILVAQYVSRQVFRPFHFSAADWVACVVRGLESANGANGHLAMRVRAVAATSGAELGGVFASSMAVLTEWGTAAASRLLGNNTSTIACASVAFTEPWRMVLELGIHAEAPSAATTATLRLGCSAASEFAFTSGLTTDLNPWFEMNRDLDSNGLGPGFQHLRGFNLG